jgi:L-ribulose-5-phosphate 3-epimerase
MPVCPVGTIIRLEKLREGIAFCRECGMDTLQLRLGDAALLPRETISAADALLRNFHAAGAVAGVSGEQVWDFRKGPSTVGLGNAALRTERTNSLIRAAEVCSRLGIPTAMAHLGFVPEEPADPDYSVYVEALAAIGRRYGELGVRFLLETGQETPETLLRLIEDAGEKAVGVNLDPANLVMYGHGSPLNAADILREYIFGLHVKDGLPPEDGDHSLGREVFPGKGEVPFPALFQKLADNGFRGAAIIEREVPDAQRLADVRRAVPMVRGWLKSAGLA